MARRLGVVGRATDWIIELGGRVRLRWNLVSINRRHFGAVRGIYSASVNVKFEEGATFIFGSWLCTANQDGKLQHELRDVTIASAPPPAQTTPVPATTRAGHCAQIVKGLRLRHDPRIVSNSENSNRTNDDSGLVALKYQDQADSRRTRLLGGLRIISSIRQGTSVRTVTSIIQEARPRSTLRLVGSVARVLFLSEQGSFFDKNPDYGNQ
nr:unnamed protein product [Digitaria exilis]